MSTTTGYLVETFVTLAAVCAIAVVVLWGARRVGFARATGPLELRGYLPIDARRAIYLVKVGEQVFVLGVSEGGFTKLGEIADRELPQGATSRAPSAFARVLARVSSTERPPEAPEARDTSAPVPSMHLPVPSLRNPVPSVPRPGRAAATPDGGPSVEAPEASTDSPHGGLPRRPG